MEFPSQPQLPRARQMQQLPAAGRWRGQSLPVAIVLALVTRRFPDGSLRYLLIRRVSEPHRGKWALIGGKWEFGEDLAGATLREVREETGLHGTFQGLRAVVNQRRIQPAPACHFLTFVSLVASREGEAEQQKEGPVTWFDRTGLRALRDRGQMIEADAAVLVDLWRNPDGLRFVETGEEETTTDER